MDIRNTVIWNLDGYRGQHDEVPATVGALKVVYGVVMTDTPWEHANLLKPMVLSFRYKELQRFSKYRNEQ